MDELFKAIISKLSGSALSADVSGRIYLDMVPEKPTFPYVVFFVVSSAPDDTFQEQMDDVLIQFSLFSESTSPAEIADMFEDCRTLFDNCTLSITGSTFVRMGRGRLTTMVEAMETSAGVQRVKHWAVEYDIQVGSL